MPGQTTATFSYPLILLTLITYNHHLDRAMNFIYPRYHFSGTGSESFAPALHDVKSTKHADRPRYLDTKADIVLSFDLEKQGGIYMVLLVGTLKEST